MKKPLPADISSLIATRENNCIEFKSTISAPFKAAREMAAMANTIGGYLIIGVADNGSVRGVDNPAQETEMVRDAAMNYCIPPVKSSITTAVVDGRTLVIADIARSSSKHIVRDARGNDLFYVRQQDKNITVSRKTALQLRRGADKKVRAGKRDRHEKVLIDYLKKHERITIPEFCHAANISKRRASRIVVRLEQATVIRAHDFEKKTFYTLNPEKTM